MPAEGFAESIVRPHELARFPIDADHFPARTLAIEVIVDENRGRDIESGDSAIQSGTEIVPFFFDPEAIQPKGVGIPIPGRRKQQWEWQRGVWQWW